MAAPVAQAATHGTLPAPGVLLQVYTGGTNGGTARSGSDISGPFHDDPTELCTSRTTSGGLSIGDNLPNSTAAASGNVDFGIVKLANSFSAVNQGEGGFVSGWSDGGWKDTLSIDSPGLTGVAGTLSFDIAITGQFEGFNFASDERVNVRVYKNNLNPPGNQAFGITDGTNAIGESPSRAIDETVNFSVPFVFGTPFDLAIFAPTRSGLRSQSGVAGSSNGSPDFSNSIIWGGISGIVANGNPVLNFSVNSASGVDWIPAVPLPASVWLLGPALGSLLWRRRARAVSLSSR